MIVYKKYWVDSVSSAIIKQRLSVFHYNTCCLVDFSVLYSKLIDPKIKGEDITILTGFQEDIKLVDKNSRDDLHRLKIEIRKAARLRNIILPEKVFSFSTHPIAMAAHIFKRLGLSYDTSQKELVVDSELYGYTFDSWTNVNQRAFEGVNHQIRDCRRVLS